MESRTKNLKDEPEPVVAEFHEGLVEVYPGLQYLDNLPKVKFVLSADVSATSNVKVADISDRVTEFIEGLEEYPELQHLAGKVVLHADVSVTSNGKVADISGGGSGHESAQAGFVGKGMLIAAICGDDFASPAAKSIIAGIRAVAGPQGCLLIVKTHTQTQASQKDAYRMSGKFIKGPKSMKIRAIKKKPSAVHWSRTFCMAPSKKCFLQKGYKGGNKISLLDYFEDEVEDYVDLLPLDDHEDIVDYHQITLGDFMLEARVLG